MKTAIKTGRTPIAVLALGLLLAGQAWAEAGRVMFVSGEASLIRGDETTITKGMNVEAGDTIVTGAGGRVQLLMADGDRIALRPNTRFSIDEFSGPAGVKAGETVTQRPSSWKSFYSLVQGGFRTLTHSLGERDKDSYQVRTPVATIGIRGTFYAAQCVGDCGAGGNGENGENGLYTGVSGGTIWLANGSGEHDVGDGLFAFIGSPDAIPEFFTEQPGVLNDTTEGGEGNWEEQVGDEGEDSEFSSRESPTEGGGTDAGDDGSLVGDGGTGGTLDGGGSGDPPTQEITGTDSSGGGGSLTGGSTPAPSSTPRGIAVGTGPVSVVSPDESVVFNEDIVADGGYVPSDTLRVDGSGNLTSFTGNVGSEQTPEFVGFTIVGGTDVANVNTGRDLSFGTGLRWGRWAGGPDGTVIAHFADGSSAGVDLSDRSLHWIYGPSTSSPPAMPISGSAFYQLIGNTDPTDNHGHTGFLGHANFSADFTNQTVSSSLGLSMDNGDGFDNWSASGNGTFGGGGSFDGSYSSCNVNGSGACSGDFAGFFTPGGSSSSPPPGAGMAYSLEDGGGTTVSGSAAFGNPSQGEGIETAQ